jgi:hypothetical protein
MKEKNIEKKEEGKKEKKGRREKRKKEIEKKGYYRHFTVFIQLTLSGEAVLPNVF